MPNKNKFVPSLILTIALAAAIFLAVFLFVSLFNPSYKEPDYNKGMGLYTSLFFFFFSSPFLFAPGILAWSYLSSGGKIRNLSFGLRYVRAVNLAMILASIGILLTVGVVPSYVQLSGKTWSASKLIDAMGIGLMIFVPGMVPVTLLTILNRALLEFKKKARIIQIILSLALLWLFPVGTILYGAALYFLWFDPRTKKIFQRQETERARE